jgi:xylulokinase
VREVAVAERATEGRDAAGLVACALAATQEVLQRRVAPVAAIGIASMAETGALVDPEGTATGPLLRWDRSGDPAARLALAGDLDPAQLHAATGAPLTPKLPLLTWGALAREGLPVDARWGFSADLVAAALTGRVATDHTLAGRSGAYRLPPSGDPLPTGWDGELLRAVGVPAGLPPEVLAPGEPVGTVRGGLSAATGAPVHIAGHDHAVAAWVAGVGEAGRIVHSLGTTEAVVALASHPVDRAAAGAHGISVVRAVDGVREGVLAGHPSAGALIADWATRAGGRASELLAAPSPVSPGPELALPYPRGRQSPAPDPDARYELRVTEPEDPEGELSAILHGLAAQGAWMRGVVAGLADGVSVPGLGPLLNRPVAAVGTPARANPRLAGLIAALVEAPIDLVDLAAPVATGAALLALERQGEIAHVTIPTRPVEPGPAPAGLVDRLIAATTQGAP